jgi:hypothetical protein
LSLFALPVSCRPSSSLRPIQSYQG